MTSQIPDYAVSQDFIVTRGQRARLDMQPAAEGRRPAVGQRGRLQAIVTPAVHALGFELVGVEFTEGRRRSRLRVYIDSENGVNVDDCARVSHQVSGVLDVEDPVAGGYDLEVSSPGLDRPLFEPAHFERFAGARVRLRTSETIGGQRNFTGVLEGMDGAQVLVRPHDGPAHRIPFASIRWARLVPEW